MAAAVGDIAGSAYEGRTHRTKDYNAVKMFSSRAHFTDDTVLTFACAEAFLKNKNMADNLWMCANQHPHAGYGHRFKQWIKTTTMSHTGAWATARLCAAVRQDGWHTQKRSA